MRFKWLTTDGMWHERVIHDQDERLKFIEWLETDTTVLEWK